MTTVTIKKALHQACMDFVKNRINNTKEAIFSNQESANEETKSSVGDKYETGRAMLQLEVENLTLQLNEAHKLEESLLHINPALVYDTVSKGALVHTTLGKYYISISAGKISHEGQDYYAIAPASPIGLAMDGMKKGDIFDWNKNKVEIVAIV